MVEKLPGREALERFSSHYTVDVNQLTAVAEKRYTREESVRNDSAPYRWFLEPLGARSRNLPLRLPWP